MSDDLMDMDFDAKYGHLTKPLKEAAMCWDMNLEDVIESFLSKDGDDSGSMNPAHMFNFAQAGMLVSSTTTNYSRKVEHLYTLVYTTLDSLSKGEGKSLATSALMKKMRKRIVGFQEFENGFELLDSQFQQPARGIDMNEGEGISNGSHITRRVPLLLLPREDSADKKDTSAGPASKQSNGTSFKTSECWISDSGCLLLDPSFAVYEDSDNLASGGRGSMGGRTSLSRPLIPGAAPSYEAIAVEASAIVDDFAEGGPRSPIFGATSPPDMELPPDTSPLMSPDEDGFKDAVSTPENNMFPPLPDTPAAVDRPKRRTRPFEAVSPAAKPAVDPWKELDPHSSSSGGRNIKLKIGRCHITPPELQTIMELRHSLSAGDVFQSRTDLFALESGETGRKNNNHLALLPEYAEALLSFREEILLELMELKKKETAAAREKRKEELKKRQEEDGRILMTSDEESDNEGERGGARFSIASHNSLRHSLDGLRASPLEQQESVIPSGVALALVPVKSKEEKALQLERERTALLERVLESSKRDYDEFMRKHLEAMSGAHDDGDVAAGGGSSQNRTAGVGAASLVATAGNSVQERIPGLYANIRKWQENLEPLLEEQNARPVFDLDDYLVSIIDKLKTTTVGVPAIAGDQKEVVNNFLKNIGIDDVSEADDSPRSIPGSTGGPVSSFEDLVKGEPKWNVCRLFLSTLILTNNGNVEIFNTETSDDTSPRSIANPSPVKARRTPARNATPSAGSEAIVGASPLRGSQTYGAGQSFQVKLRNADKNLKFAVEDNTAVVTGIIPIVTNKGLLANEPVGDVPFMEDE